MEGRQKNSKWRKLICFTIFYQTMVYSKAYIFKNINVIIIISTYLKSVDFSLEGCIFKKNIFFHDFHVLLTGVPP